jgi:glycine C-acetyltransferase
MNFCANNYLGLADHPALVAAAKAALDTYGFGMSSVRFICGTLDIHKRLEARISAFLGTDDTILYTSCFDANGGLFETLLGADDAIVSDALNHASIIDGIRLCKAHRFRYEHDDLDDLDRQLQAARRRRRREAHPGRDGRRVLDGRRHRPARPDLRSGREVRRDGDGRRLPRHRLRRPHRARQHRAPRGDGPGGRDHQHPRQGARGRRGWLHHRSREIIELLRQRSRPYLFSNTVAPPIVGASSRRSSC